MLPNADWSFDNAGNQWRAVFQPNTIPANRYRQFARDSITGARSLPHEFVVSAPMCQWSAFVPGPVTAPSDPCGTGNQGAMVSFNGYDWTCMCQ